jgi:alanine dehydrogenase
MEIGIPKETKDQEFRVGLSPSSVRVLRENGHSMLDLQMMTIKVLAQKLSLQQMLLGIEI